MLKMFNFGKKNSLELLNSFIYLSKDGLIVKRFWLHIKFVQVSSSLVVLDKYNIMSITYKPQLTASCCLKIELDHSNSSHVNVDKFLKCCFMLVFILS